MGLLFFGRFLDSLLGGTGKNGFSNLCTLFNLSGVGLTFVFCGNIWIYSSDKFCHLIMMCDIPLPNEFFYLIHYVRGLCRCFWRKSLTTCCAKFGCGCINGSTFRALTRF